MIDRDDEQFFYEPNQRPRKNWYQKPHLEYEQLCSYQVVRQQLDDQSHFWLAIKWNDFVLKATLNEILKPHLFHFHHGQLKLFSGGFTKENFFDLGFWQTPRFLKILFLTINQQDERLTKHPVLNFTTELSIVYDPAFIQLVENQSVLLKQTYNLASNQNALATFIGIINPNRYQIEADLVSFRFIDDESVQTKIFSIPVFAFNSKYYDSHRRDLLSFANATQDEQIIQSAKLICELPQQFLNRQQFDHLWILFEKFFQANKTFVVELVRRQYYQGKQARLYYWLNHKQGSTYLKIQPFSNHDLKNRDWDEIRRQLLLSAKRDQDPDGD